MLVFSVNFANVLNERSLIDYYSASTFLITVSIDTGSARFIINHRLLLVFMYRKTSRSFC